MRGVLLIVVLTSVYMLHVGSVIPIQPNFDVQKLSGKWYPIAVVMDREVPDIKEVIGNIAQPSDNGELLLKVHYYQNHVCGIKKLHLCPTDKPGKFTVRGSSSTIRVVEVDYGSYCIFHIAEDDHNVLYLYSRERDVSDDLKEKYMNHVTSLKFPADNIHYIRTTGHCPE